MSQTKKQISLTLDDSLLERESDDDTAVDFELPEDADATLDDEILSAEDLKAFRQSELEPLPDLSPAAPATAAATTPDADTETQSDEEDNEETDNEDEDSEDYYGEDNEDESDFEFATSEDDYPDEDESKDEDAILSDPDLDDLFESDSDLDTEAVLEELLSHNQDKHSKELVATTERQGFYCTAMRSRLSDSDAKLLIPPGTKDKHSITGLYTGMNNLPAGAQIRLVVRLKGAPIIGMGEKVGALQNPRSSEPGPLDGLKTLWPYIKWAGHLGWKVAWKANHDMKAHKPDKDAKPAPPQDPIEKKLVDLIVTEKRQKLETDDLLHATVWVIAQGDKADQTEIDKQLLKMTKYGFPTLKDLKWVECDPREITSGRPYDPMVLSPAEVASFARFPDKDVKVVGVATRESFLKPIGAARMPSTADANNPEPGLIPIGIDGKGTDNERVICLTESSLDTGIAISGQIGTGKSQLSIALALAIIRLGRSLIYNDPHGLGAKELLAAILTDAPEHAHRVVYNTFDQEEIRDATNPDIVYMPGRNPLDISNPSQLVKAVTAVLDQIVMHLGIDISSHPASYRYIKLAFIAMASANLHLAASEKITIIQITDFFDDTDFRDMVVKSCKIGAVRKYYGKGGRWDGYKEAEQLKMSGPIVNKMNDLSLGDFGLVYASPTNSYDNIDLILENKIIINNYASMSGGGEIASYFGAELMSELNRRIAEFGYNEQNPNGPHQGVTVILDETSETFQNDPILGRILARHRKTKLQLIMITQYWSYFATNVRDGIFANAKTIFTGALDIKDAEIIAPRIDKSEHAVVTPKDVQKTPNFCWYGTTNINGESGDPLVFESLPPKKFNADGGTVESGEGDARIKKAMDVIRRNGQRLYCNSSEEMNRRLEIAPKDDEFDEKEPMRTYMTKLSMQGLERVNRELEQAASRRRKPTRRPAASDPIEKARKQAKAKAATPAVVEEDLSAHLGSGFNGWETDAEEVGAL